MDKRLPGENARRKNPENPLILKILILTKPRGARRLERSIPSFLYTVSRTKPEGN